MYLVIYGISLLPVRISTVLQIGGSLTAAPLIMIFPSLLYLKLIQLCYFKKTLITYVLWSLITIGVSLMIIGTSMAIIDAVRGEKEKMVRYWCQSVLE
ncbi:hypothetical protein MXB_653 [Myxobolus squamalis]|nr:hypothetical protein MXB_653 [Myxobolus squamalis]